MVLWEATGEPQARGPRALLCLGDSLSERGFAGLRMWPEQLLRRGLLSDAVNRARAGASTRDVLVAWRQARAGGPYRWVAVLAGTNDIWLDKVPREESLRNLRAIWSEARADGAAVIAMTVPPFRGDPYGLWSPEKQAEQDALNAAIRQEARERGYALVDAWTLLRGTDEPAALAGDCDSGDHVHLNQACQARLANAVARFLE